MRFTKLSPETKKLLKHIAKVFFFHVLLLDGVYVDYEWEEDQYMYDQQRRQEGQRRKKERTRRQEARRANTQESSSIPRFWRRNATAKVTPE